MSLRPSDLDPFETSSFSSLIEQEEREEVIPLDLHTAALIGDIDTVRECMRQKFNLDHLSRGGWSALMYAAYVGRANILNLLLEAGARIDIKSTNVKLGSTALMLASYCATENILFSLLQHGASINLRDSKGLTSLHYAVRRCNQNAVKLLAAKGADLNFGEYSTGITPIMEAAMCGHENIFNILLDHGADINLRTKKGETVRNLALRYKKTSIVSIIDNFVSPKMPIREEPSLPEKIGGTISSGGIHEGSIQDGPAYVNQLLRNTPNVISARSQDFATEFSDKVSIQSQAPTPMSNSFSADFQSAGMPKSEKLQGILKPPIDVFSQNPPISQIPPKLPDTLCELLTEYNLQVYLPKFESEGLDVTTFLELCDDDLKELGVDKFGPRKKMLVAIRTCKERMAAHDPNIDPVQVDQYQVRIRDLTMHLQQTLSYCKNLQSQLYQAQQYRQEFANYYEAESQRMQQIYFYTNDIGKNCKEVSTQIRKVMDYNNRLSMVLQKLKGHPNFFNLSNELCIGSSVFEAAKKVECELEMASNRLEMTYKQAERTLIIAQGDVQNTQHNK